MKGADWGLRLVAVAVLGWALGFLWFALAMPGPLPVARHTDGIVVLTGGSGRIARAITLLRAGAAPRLLVSGVYEKVTPAIFAHEYAVDPALLDCCITLGTEATNTRANAREAAQWIARAHVRSIRLVTNDWHMRRAEYDMAAATPPGTVILPDAVPSRPSLKVLFLEYNKYLGRLVYAKLAGTRFDPLGDRAMGDKP